MNERINLLGVPRTDLVTDSNHQTFKEQLAKLATKRGFSIHRVRRSVSSETTDPDGTRRITIVPIVFEVLEGFPRTGDGEYLLQNPGRGCYLVELASWGSGYYRGEVRKIRDTGSLPENLQQSEDKKGQPRLVHRYDQEWGYDLSKGHYLVSQDARLELVADLRGDEFLLEFSQVLGVCNPNL